MDGGRRRRRRRMDSPPPLSRFGFDYFPGTNLPMFGSYFYYSPPDDDHPYRTGRYTVAPHDEDDDSRNKRARVADEDATLRRQLPEVAPGSSAGDCAICLQDLVVVDPEEEGKEATPRAMPCSHAFHERCIFKWIRHNRDCPLCRRTLQMPTPEQQEYSIDDDDRLQKTMPVPREMLEVEVL